jgi:hypothetical protein
MRLINLTPLHEIDFRNQAAFDTYNKQHKLRPDTKVNIAGKNTTAGQAAQSSTPVKGTSVFGGDNKEKYPVGTKFFKPNGNQNIEVVRVEGDKIFVVSDIMPGKEWQWREDGIDDDIKNQKLQVKPDASLNGTSALNKPKSKDLVSSVENHLNKASGGEGYAQIDDGSGAIIYNMGDGDMPTYTLYMGKEGSKHRVTLEPTYGNDPKKLQGNIDKSFDKVQDAVKFMGDVAKKHRRELEMDDNKKSDTSLSSMIPNKVNQQYNPAQAFNQKVSKMTDNNAHSAAAVELAIYMDDKEAVSKLQQIKKYHDNRGYLQPGEAKERGEIVNNLLQRAQKELPKKDFDLVSGAF